MKLISLDLANFRQHKELSVDFSDGITGIIGRNGSGKTTILESISFAFYGSKAIRGKIEDLKTRNIEKRDQLKVSLKFSTNNISYVLTRGLNDALLVTLNDEKRIASGLKDVTASVEQLLSMNYEEFSATYLTEQKSLEFLGSKKSAIERERFITKMLGFHRVDKVQEKIRLERNSLKSELSGLEAGIGSSDSLEKQLASEKEAALTLSQKCSEAERSFIKLDTDTKEAKKVYDRLHKQVQEYESVLKLQRDTQVKLQALQLQIQNLEQQRSKWNYSVEQETLTEAEYQKLSAAAQNLSADISRRKESFIKQQAEFQFKLKAINKEISILESKLSNLSSLDNEQCPTCGQLISQDQCSRNFAQQLEVHQQNKSELSLSDTDLQKEGSEITKLEAAAVKQTAEIKDLEKKLIDFKHAKNIAEEIAKLTTEKNSLTEKLTAASPAAYAGDPDKLTETYTSAKTSYETQNRLLEIARLQKLKLDGELSTQKALIARTEQELLTHSKKSASLLEKKKRLALLETGDLSLTDFRRYLNTTLRPMLAERASLYLTELTDGRYTTIDLPDDFTPTVIEDGEPKPVISGGEEDIVNLAMRLSLSSILADRAGHDFSLLILDEIFGALDEQRRNNVLFLLEKLKLRFEQIILVTHLDDIKEGVEKVVEL